MRRREGPSPMLIGVLTSGGLAVLFFGLVFLNNLQTPRSQPTGQQPTTKRQQSPPKASLANFQEVQKGMTKAQVIQILGPQYTAEFSVDTGDVSTEVLKWDQGDNRVAVVGFSNNKVISHSQVRLK